MRNRHRSLSALFLFTYRTWPCWKKIGDRNRWWRMIRYKADNPNGTLVTDNTNLACNCKRQRPPSPSRSCQLPSWLLFYFSPTTSKVRINMTRKLASDSVGNGNTWAETPIFRSKTWIDKKTFSRRLGLSWNFLPIYLSYGDLNPS